MSKTFQIVCVVLLSLIFATQLVNLFVSVRPKIAGMPMTARANLASDDTYYDNCWMFWGTGYCNPYSGYVNGGQSSSNVNQEPLWSRDPKFSFPYLKDDPNNNTSGTDTSGTPGW